MGRDVQVPACRPYVWVCLTLLPLALSAPAQEPTQADGAAALSGVKAMQTELAALAALRDKAVSAFRQETQLAAEKDPPRALTLSFPNAIPANFGLTVNLCRINGVWPLAKGTVPKFNGSTHEVDASQLSITPDGLEGTMKVTLMPGHNGSGCAAPVSLEFRVRAALAAGRVTGKFATRCTNGNMESREGEIAGTVAPADVEVRIPVPDAAVELARVAVDKIPPADLYETALKMDAAATDAYQQLRALGLARAHNLTFAAAWANARIAAPVRTAKDAATIQYAPEKPGPTGAVYGWEPCRGPEQQAGGPTAANFRAMREYVSALRRLADEALARPADRGGWLTNGAKTDDPDFGPWFGAEPLAHSDRKPNALPPEAGADGPQWWPYIGQWHVLGPLPRTDRGFNSLLLPEVVMAPHSRYLVDLAKVGATGKSPAYRGKNVIGWLLTRALACSGLVQPLGPDMWMSPGTPGLGNVCYYAHAQVYSEKDQTLWAGVNVNNHGKLWINNRLVWVSPPYENPDAEHHTYIFPVAFQQGLNSVLFRCDNDGSGMYFDVRICVRGKPRTAAAAAEHRAAVEKAQAARPAILAGVQTWRGDLTGRWPDARPPLAWNPATGANVLWHTTLPEYSHASPVIVGERIFTPFEPHFLACLRKTDGKLLWIREANLAEAKPEALKELKALEDPGWKVWEELQPLGPNRELWFSSLTAKGLAEPDVTKKVGAIGSLIGGKGSEWWACFEKHFGITRPGWRSDYGYTMSTPVTDGKQVWVKFGTGVLACYDLEGNRKWMTNTGYWTMHPNNVASPILVGNILIAQFTADPKNANDERNLLIGFDASTGKTNWTLKTRRRSASTATPVPMRLTNGRETLDVVVDSCGNVVRVDDGKLLMGQIGTHELWGTPLPIGDTLFMGSQLGWRALIRLIMVDRDTVGCKFQWYFLDYRGYRQHGSYAVYDDGTIYTWEDHCGCVFDYATGASLKSFQSVRRAQPWPPLALAGRHLYLPGKGGGITVCEAHRDATKLVAFSDWEGGNAGPLFEADRMYLRGRHSLWCIGYTGEAGKNYEQEQLKLKAEEAKQPPVARRP